MIQTSSAQLSQSSEKLSLDSFKNKPNPARIGSENFHCKIWVWVFFSQKSLESFNFQSHVQWSLINQCFEFWLSKMILILMVTGLWYHHILNFGYICKEHPSPLSFPVEAGGSWLELESWSWLWYGHWSLIHLFPNFGSLSWFWRCKEHPCPLSPHLVLWRMLEVPDWDLASWSWLGWVKIPCLEHPWNF